MRIRAAALIGARFGGGLFAPALPVCGIALGVALLICALSLMNGFERAFREHVLGLTPHLLIEPGDAGQFAQMEEAVRERAAELAQIQGMNPFVQLQGALRFAGKNRPALMHSLDPANPQESVSVAAYLPSETPPQMLRRGELLLGSLLARSLGVEAGQSLTALFPQRAAAGVRLQTARFQVRAVFDSGSEVDRALAFMHLEDARQWADRLGVQTALRLRLERPERAPRLSYFLRETLPVEAQIRDWTVAQGNLFSAVQMSRRLITILLLAVVLVAAFNVTAAMLLMIDQRRGEIALMGVMGASRGLVLLGVLLRGLLLGCSGILLGLLAGTAISLVLEDALRAVQSLLGMQLLSRETYFLDHLPVEIVPENLISVALLTLLLCLLAALYPAWRAAGIRPIHALRWE